MTPPPTPSPAPSTPVRLVEEGVYLLRGPARATVALNRELLVVFATDRDACGLLLLFPDTGTRTFAELADALFAKMTLGLAAGMGPIHVKLFGASHAPYAMLRGVREWLDDRGLRVVAQDLGKNVTRNVTVDGATGVACVSYSESFSPAAPFLAGGSVRTRRQAERPAARFLVLAASPVTRTLATQVIEETPGFHADAPERPEEIFTSGRFAWTHVLLFEDVAGPSAAGTWIEKLLSHNSDVRCFWVAERLPQKMSSWLESAYWLPPLAPESIGSFKHAFIEAVLVESTWNPADRVVRLKKTKKR